jgi:hypothetical protein
MRYNEILSKVSEETGLPIDIINKTYKAYWDFIKQTIQSMPLKEENIKEDEFLKLRPSFNVPSLGKLSCTYDRFLGIKRRYDLIKKVKEKC